MPWSIPSLGTMKGRNPISGSRGLTLTALLVFACMLGVQSAIAQASDRPSTLLEDATLDQARRFAINAAIDRGWAIGSSSGRSAVFEQTLEPIPGETEYDSQPATLLRIIADFAPGNNGTTVLLQADEIRNPGEQGQTIVDVTQLYRDNLMNALWSLRMKWETRDYVPPPDPGPAPVRESRIQTARQGNQGPPVGIWAYYAEQFARDQGCMLSDRGAVLEFSGTETERHRVYCEGSPSISITCSSNSCWRAR